MRIRLTVSVLLLSAVMALSGCKVGSSSNDPKNVPDADEDPNSKKIVNTVVIDPGHQEAPMNEREPIGPGAKETKPMLSSGTQGIATRVPEYQLTLDVSLKLRDVLKQRGYKVVMIREDNKCPISNKGRADIANKYKNAVFLRIHANSDANKSIKGMLTMCPSKNNPYVSGNIEPSRRLSEDVLNEMLKATGAQNRGIIETDKMTGINWCKIPVTIIEMGFMSNPEEDKLMQTEAYQRKLADGMANGVDRYFATVENDKNKS